MGESVMALAVLSRHQWTIADYERMIAAGIFYAAAGIVAWCRTVLTGRGRGGALGITPPLHRTSLPTSWYNRTHC
jgi:hypothetical protein